MLNGARVGVVVPAYNEEGQIGTVLSQIPDFVDTIIVVDDASRDRTVEAAGEHQKRMNGRLVILQHDRNKGVGAAITTGYKKAVEQGLDVVAIMAGDAQMDPRDLRDLVAPVTEKRVEYTKGNRLFTQEGWSLIPRYRFFGNLILSFLTKVASGYWHIADSQTGYTAISLSALRRLNLDRLYPRYGFPNDILVKLNVIGARVIDVPITPLYKVGERSGIRVWRVMPVMVWLLIKGFCYRMFQKYIVQSLHPLVLFYTMGALLLPPGLLLGIYLVVYRFTTGDISPSSALLSAFLLISGLQLWLFGMLFYYLDNARLR